MSVRITEAKLGPLTWYVASAIFTTAYEARQAWEHVDAKVPHGSLGLYRHGPQERQGLVVTVVSTDYQQMLRCARLLRTGQDYALDEVTRNALIARRARVVLAHAGQGSGRVKTRHPETGARLDPDGTIRPAQPGQG